MHLSKRRHRIGTNFRLSIARLAILVSAATVLAGCGGEKGEERGVPDELVGTYEADLPDAAGTSTISIGADRSFLIKNPGRRPFSTGPITVGDDELVLSPDEFGDCTERGTYAYRLDDGRLTLTAMNDPCAGRADDLSRSWFPSSAVAAGVRAERRKLEQYRARRNAICKKRTIEAEAVNASAASVGESVALRRLGAVMRKTQADLDTLEVPNRFDAFVTRDRKLRTERIDLQERLADALEHDRAAAGVLGQELVQENVIPTERAEDQYFLTHCP